MDHFYAATTISVGNGEKTLFREVPWLNGAAPKDIEPLVYVISLRKKWNIKKSLTNDAWIAKINMNANITMEHIQQFVTLWALLQEINLVEDLIDTITWKLKRAEYTRPNPPTRRNS
jgi:hypothetical protein